MASGSILSKAAAAGLAAFLTAGRSLAAEPANMDCAEPWFDKEVLASLTRVAELSPEDAGRDLSALQKRSGREGLVGHPALGMLLAMRSRGHAPMGARFCGGQPGQRWVGVRSKEGRYFRLDLGADKDPVDLAKIEEVRIYAPASRPGGPTAGPDAQAARPALTAERRLELTAEAAETASVLSGRPSHRPAPADIPDVEGGPVGRPN